MSTQIYANDGNIELKGDVNLVRKNDNTDSELVFQGSSYNTSLRVGDPGVNYTLLLPDAVGGAGQVLITDGNNPGKLSFNNFNLYNLSDVCSGVATPELFDYLVFDGTDWCKRPVGRVNGTRNTSGGAEAYKGSAGIDNTAWGYRAMYSITTGSRNVGIGNYALYSTSTSDQNTAIGNNALKNNNASFNTAIGTSSLSTNIGGSRCTAIGHFSSSGNTTGNDNISVGDTALRFNTTGSRNIGIGTSSLYYNISGDQNTAVGHNTLKNNTASDNTAVGYIALYSNTIGTRNTAVGLRSLQSNTTGNDNTSSGFFSLRYNTIGNRNTAFGSFALSANTIGNDNTSSGYDSLRFNTTGIRNTAFGAYALRLNTTSDQNTAVGYMALLNNNNATNNTALGCLALLNNNANNNTALGSFALRNNVSGIANTAIGYESLLDNVSGTRSVAIGFRALRANITSNNNTAIGSNALLVFNGTDTNNTAVGFNALSLNPAYGGVTAIGANAQATASSQFIVATNNANKLLTNFGEATGIFGGQRLMDITINGTSAKLPLYDVSNTDIPLIELKQVEAVNQVIGYDGTTWTNLVSGSGGSSVERITVPSGANVNPDVTKTTTFITTTYDGTNFADDATGFLANGVTDGGIHNFIAVNLLIDGTTVTKYVLDAQSTILLDANGLTVGLVEFGSTGNSISLVWDATLETWFIISAGTTLLHEPR